MADDQGVSINQPSGADVEMPQLGITTGGTGNGQLMPEKRMPVSNGNPVFTTV